MLDLQDYLTAELRGTHARQPTTALCIFIAIRFLAKSILFYDTL